MKLARLRDIAEFINGVAFKPDDWGNEGMKIIRIQNLTDSSKPYNFTKRKVDDKYIVKKGDVLVSWSATIDVFTWDAEDALVNQHIFKVVFDESKVIKPYFIFALKSTIDSLSKFAHGSTMKHVVKKDFDNHEIPLPAIKDQIQIANMLGKAETLINQRKESLRLLDEFLKSTFLEMFGDPIINPHRFPVRTLNEFYISQKEGTKCGPFGSALKKHEYLTNGIPVWVMDNISTNGKLIEHGCLYISEEKFASLEAYNVIPGDVIISRAGTVGKMCVVTSVVEKSIISTNLIRVRFGKDLLPVYFISLMNYCKSRVARLRTGSDDTFTHMNTSVLDAIMFPYPPLQLQRRFAHVIEKTEVLKAQYEVSLQQLEILYASLSQKAFKGELQFKSDTKVVPLYIDEKEEDYFKKRKALACYIINQSLDDEKFGDTKFEKVLNLSDQYAIQRNLGQAYYQNVAGPYDTFTKLFYLQIEKERLYKRTRRNRQTIFIPDINHNKTFTAENYFSKDELTRVDKLIAYFKKYTYEQPEIISTLYAVWNNRIIRQQQITNEVLKQEFLDWDAKKKKYKDRLDAALAWMKKENIIPNGWGKLIEKPKGKQRKLIVGKKRSNSKSASQ